MAHSWANAAQLAKVFVSWIKMPIFISVIFTHLKVNKKWQETEFEDTGDVFHAMHIRPRIHKREWVVPTSIVTKCIQVVHGVATSFFCVPLATLQSHSTMPTRRCGLWPFLFHSRCNKKFMEKLTHRCVLRRQRRRKRRFISFAFAYLPIFYTILSGGVCMCRMELTVHAERHRCCCRSHNQNAHESVASEGSSVFERGVVVPSASRIIIIIITGNRKWGDKETSVLCLCSAEEKKNSSQTLKGTKKRQWRSDERKGMIFFCL